MREIRPYGSEGGEAVNPPFLPLRALAEALDAVEFLHRACLHIPNPYEAGIRYCGHYANAARGKRRKLGLEDAELPIVVDDAPERKN